MARAKTPLKSASWRASIGFRPLKWILLALVLVLLLLGHGFGAKWWEEPPSGQPAQMWSQVDYDPKLTHPFFESHAWSYPDYNLQGIPLDKRPKKPPRLKHTAKCSSNSFGVEHEVRFCEAKLPDGYNIDLLIHESDPAFEDRLRVSVRNEMFTCQYWTLYKFPTGDLMWTTKRQELTLHKKVYRKGDVIQGRIDFECEERPADAQYTEERGRDPTVIRVQGVFKTIVR